MRVCPTCSEALDDEMRFCPHDGTPLAGVRAWQDPMIGKVIDDRYRIASRLGAGGMAVVYLAQQLILGMDVAMKVLRPGLDGDVRQVGRFAREARAVSRVDHDNVVAVLDFGCAAEGFYYLVMEHLSGTSLDAELARAGALPLPRVAHILAQVAAGMRRAHQVGLVHRDLKPANVMLTRRGSDSDFVKIVDFGLTKPVGAHASMPALTRVGEIFGTPEYMAPEQWKGSSADPRTDVYAFGALAYELLVGKPPFRGSLADVVLGHTERVPDAPSHVSGREVPPALDELVLHCLAKSPDERPGSMDAVLSALGRVWASIPRHGGHTSYSGTSGAPPRPNADALPDPTVYRSSSIDVVWDGPMLCDEVRRLHALRDKRLDELTRALWGSGARPAEVEEVHALIGSFEADVEMAGQEIAVLAAHLEEHAERVREKEASLRGEMIDASLRLGGVDVAGLGAIGDGATIPQLKLPSGEHSLSDTRPGTVPPPDDHAGRLRFAERRMISQRRRARRERANLEGQMTDCLKRMRDAEVALAPLYERLAGNVQAAAARRPDVRPLVVAFGKIDGALAAYQALLDMIETS